MTLKDILRFTDFLLQFQKVERVVRVKGEDRWENDVEHSYQLAMLAWYAADVRGLSLDKTKILKYALVHDLVEVHAGDTYFVDTLDPSAMEEKTTRERAAMEQLKREWPEFSDMHASISAYENLSDGEAKFVYVLDKLIPVFNIYLDNGRTFREKGITIEQLVEHKIEKVKQSPELEPYFHELVQLLREQPSLFAKRKHESTKI